LRIVQLIHPDFLRNSYNWKKYRLVYEGGTNFLRTYLRKFSKREDERDFFERKSISYSPSFAKAAINDVRNAIAQRFPDIIREGGSKTYTEAIAGRDGGINLTGTSMNTFLSTKILPELLALGRVGIYIDMPSETPITLADTFIARPYLYRYLTEQIRSWTYDPRRPDKLLAVLVEDVNFIMDPSTNLTVGTQIFYRHMWLKPEGVYVQFYDLKGDIQLPEPFLLELDELPFVILELSDSLLLDIADYQIGLLNLESSDLNYVLRCNFPFYVEQYDPRSSSPYLKQPGHDQGIISNDYATQIISEEQIEEVETGTGAGRRYPIGAQQPAFINPSSEPLRASMDKGEQIKRDIKLLLNLAIGNLQPPSGEKTDTYNNPIEAGLVIIGSILETAERRIGEIWSKYERNNNVPSIIYPETYNLRTDEDRRTEAKELTEMIPKIPSKTYQKELSKQIASITIGHKISAEVMSKIKKEIDAAEVVISDPDIIKTDLEEGLVGIDLASKIRGYPPGQVEAAKKDHADRVARIAVSQTLGAAKEITNNGMDNPESRGIPDLGTNKNGSKEEKKESRDKTLDEIPKDHVRGEGK
jgi:hypothetical protein